MFDTLGGSLYHYTPAVKALAYILPTRQLRLGPFSTMRDPRESGRWLISATLDVPDRDEGYETIDATVRAELIEGRDLHEHSIENIPVFNQTPRVQVPRYPSGKAFADRNPNASPYDWLDWTSNIGARLLPHVSAFEVYALVDAVEAEVLAAFPELERFVPPRADSPWIHEDDQWWPKQAATRVGA